MKIWLTKILHYFQASILSEVTPPVLLLSIYTAGLVAINQYVGKIQASNLPFIAALSVVIGFLLVFRTNTAYDRYWEGRKLWSQMVHLSKSFSRLIWTHVHSQDAKQELLMEKKKALKLILLFLHSVKRKLRNEHSLSRLNQDYYRDPRRMELPTVSFTNLLPDLTKKERESTEQLLREEEIDIDGLKVTHASEDIQVLDLTGEIPPENPLTCIEDLSQFIYHQARVAKNLDGPLANNLEMAILNPLSDAYHGCLRILRSPLPRAYTIHLTHILFLYCITFPFGIIKDFTWLSIPISAIVFFVFIGVYKIAKEIENPFGTDYNDLPLEAFLMEAEFEIKRIAGEA